MKTRKLLKFTLSIALLAFMSVNVLGQENAPWDDMTGSSSDTENDSVVVNTTVPYYVEPDPVLNDLSGQYDPSQANDDQGISSIFSWNETTGDVGFSAPTSDEDAPYREVTFNAATSSPYTIEVQEQASAGCPGSITSQDVTVLSEPSYTINTTTYEVCDGGTQPLNIDNITAGLAGSSSFYFHVDVTKQTVEDADGTNSQIVYTHSDSIIKVSGEASAIANLGINQTYTTGAYDYGDGEGDVDRITEYEYTINGFNHHIARKGGFLNLTETGSSPDITREKETFDTYADYSTTEINYYPWYGGVETITVTVFPEPTTGDIYYVPNNYEL